MPVLFPGRRVGNRMSMPVRSNLPLMVNMAGMIPLDLCPVDPDLPGHHCQLLCQLARPTGWPALPPAFTTPSAVKAAGMRMMYFVMVVAFTFFYTDVLFTQQNYGENLKKQGAQIPGVVRGAPTQKYLTKVQRRITFPGAFSWVLWLCCRIILNAVLPAQRRNAGLFLISSAGLADRGRCGSRYLHHHRNRTETARLRRKPDQRISHDGHIHCPAWPSRSRKRHPG